MEYKWVDKNWFLSVNSQLSLQANIVSPAFGLPSTCYSVVSMTVGPAQKILHKFQMIRGWEKIVELCEESILEKLKKCCFLIFN